MLLATARIAELSPSITGAETDDVAKPGNSNAPPQMQSETQNRNQHIRLPLRHRSPSRTYGAHRRLEAGNTASRGVDSTGGLLIGQQTEDDNCRHSRATTVPQGLRAQNQAENRLKG
jgi:hypothetical protein